MKKQILALALASTMALLAACGGNGGNSGSQSSGSQSGGGASSSGVSSSDVSTPDTSKPDTSTPDVSAPDTSKPDTSAPDTSKPDGSQPDTSKPDTSKPEEKPVAPKPDAKTLTLNKSDFTLFKAGATYQLKAKAEPAGGKMTWSSSDEKVATVSENGTVTAVAPGSATITVTDASTGLTAKCIVRCRWEEKQPDNGGSSSQGGSSSESSKPAGNVDLSAFYSNISSQYDISLNFADSATLDAVYTGLTGIGTEQCLVYVNSLSMNTGEFALVQVKDSKDVATVKGILQARINFMVGDGNGPGGAWYPEATEEWKNNSRVVSNGNYVMMIVHESADSIVDAFNNLF